MAGRSKRRVKQRSKAHRKHVKKGRSRRIKSRANVRNATKKRRRKKARQGKTRSK
jgi:hypothetical protein